VGFDAGGAAGRERGGAAEVGFDIGGAAGRERGGAGEVAGAADACVAGLFLPAAGAGRVGCVVAGGGVLGAGRHALGGGVLPGGPAAGRLGDGADRAAGEGGEGDDGARVAGPGGTPGPAGAGLTVSRILRASSIAIFGTGGEPALTALAAIRPAIRPSTRSRPARMKKPQK
jgi:hypothetical protein